MATGSWRTQAFRSWVRTWTRRRQGMDVIYKGTVTAVFGLNSRLAAHGTAWVKHTIDESCRRLIALQPTWSDGDGEPELIAGKRYRGRVETILAPPMFLVVYYYKIDRKTGTFTRYPISVNGRHRGNAVRWKISMGTAISNI